MIAKSQHYYKSFGGGFFFLPFGMSMCLSSFVIHKSGYFTKDKILATLLVYSVLNLQKTFFLVQFCLSMIFCLQKYDRQNKSKSNMIQFHKNKCKEKFPDLWYVSQ